MEIDRFPFPYLEIDTLAPPSFERTNCVHQANNRNNERKMMKYENSRDYFIEN